MSQGQDQLLDLQTYASLSVALSDPQADRDQLLAEHGLTAERWEAIDEAWQQRLSQATEEAAESEPIPKLLADYAKAFAEAQSQRAGAPIDFVLYLEASRGAKHGQDIQAVLKRVGISFEQFLAAHQYWTQRMMQDPALLERYQRAMSEVR